MDAIGSVHTKSQLIGFSHINAGDYIAIPANQGLGIIHFGLVLKPDKERYPPYITPRITAYHFYHDIAKEEYYECAHRVNVLWAMDENGKFGVYVIKGFEGIWRQAFRQIKNDKTIPQLELIARKTGLWF